MKVIKDTVASSQKGESRKVESAFRDGKYLEEALGPRAVRLKLQNR